MYVLRCDASHTLKSPDPSVENDMDRDIPDDEDDDVEEEEEGSEGGVGDGNEEDRRLVKQIDPDTSSEEYFPSAVTGYQYSSPLSTKGVPSSSLFTIAERGTVTSPM